MVVAWFCECGSMVRMSFCAAQRSGTAWALKLSAKSAAANDKRMFMKVPSRTVQRC